MSTATTEKWLEEQRKKREELYARQDKVIKDAIKAAEKIIQDSGEDKWPLIRDLAKKLITKAEGIGRKPILLKKEKTSLLKLISLQNELKSTLLVGRAYWLEILELWERFCEWTAITQ